MRQLARRVQGWKLRPQCRVLQLKDLLRVQDVAQAELAEGFDGHTRWQRVSDQTGHGVAEQHLAPMRRIEDAGQAVEGGSQIVPVLRLGFANVQGHSYPQGSGRIGPGLSEERPLPIERRAHPKLGRGKSRLRAVPNDLVEDAAVGGDDAAQYGEVPLDRHAHGGAVAFPQASRTFDVGEQEGDRPAGQLGHAPPPVKRARLIVALSHAGTDEQAQGAVSASDASRKTMNWPVAAAVVLRRDRN
jgi:hypothetical protein